MIDWIEVGESPPEEGEEVLTFCRGGGYDIGFYEGDGMFFDFFSNRFPADYWQPLPEPPK